MEGLERQAKAFSPSCLVENVNIFQREGGLAVGEVFLHGALSLYVLFETDLHMPASFTDIARCAAWTLQLIHNSASIHFLYCWFKRRKHCFQLTQSHHYHTGCVDLIQCSCVVLCAFTAILNSEFRFLRFLGTRCCRLRGGNRWLFRYFKDVLKGMFWNSLCIWWYDD